MSHIMKCFVLALAASALTFGVAACDKKEGDGATPPASASAVASAAPKEAASAAAATAAADAPSEEDFEDEAETAVTESNLEAEVAKLEAELSGD